MRQRITDDLKVGKAGVPKLEEKPRSHKGHSSSLQYDSAVIMKIKVRAANSLVSWEKTVSIGFNSIESPQGKLGEATDTTTYQA